MLGFKDFKDFLIESIEFEKEININRFIVAREMLEWIETNDSLFFEDIKEINGNVKDKEEQREDGDEERAKEWFDQLRGKIYSNRKSKQGTFTNYRTTNAVLLGRVYSFRYDPKTKDELKFFDETPLVIPFSYKKGKTDMGFLGINLHFVPRQQRRSVMDYFMSKDPEQVMKDGTLDIDYVKDLKNNPKLKYVYYIIRHYLLGNVRGSFYLVPQEDYFNVLNLYSGRYIGMTEPQIMNIIKMQYSNSLYTPKIKKNIQKRKDYNKKRRDKAKIERDKINTIIKPNKNQVDINTGSKKVSIEVGKKDDSSKLNGNLNK